MAVWPTCWTCDHWTPRRCHHHRWPSPGHDWCWDHKPSDGETGD